MVACEFWYNWKTAVEVVAVYFFLLRVGNLQSSVDRPCNTWTCVEIRSLPDYAPLAIVCNDGYGLHS